MRDICEMYQTDGIKDYETLLHYSRRGIPIQIAATMLSGFKVGGHGVKERLRDGSFRIKSTAHIEEVLQIVETLVEKYPEARSIAFISAVSAFLKLDGFMSDRLIHSILRQSKIEKSATVVQMMEQLEEMYNFAQRSRDNIAFRAQEALRMAKVARITKATEIRLKKSA
jgi:hypothetical protein